MSTVREVITELERFDDDAEVIVYLSETRMAMIADIGQRHRDRLGIHPVVYLTREQMNV